jgi:hypothetical protein
MERVINEILAGIDGGNFYAGIYLVDDRVTEAAPIVGLSTREERVRRAVAGAAVFATIAVLAVLS